MSVVQHETVYEKERPRSFNLHVAPRLFGKVNEDGNFEYKFKVSPKFHGDFREMIGHHLGLFGYDKKMYVFPVLELRTYPTGRFNFYRLYGLRVGSPVNEAFDENGILNTMLQDLY